MTRNVNFNKNVRVRKNEKKMVLKNSIFGPYSEVTFVFQYFCPFYRHPKKIKNSLGCNCISIGDGGRVMRAMAVCIIRAMHLA